MNLVGKKWNEIPIKMKKTLLKNANTVNGVTCNKVDEGNCIVDLSEKLSIPGKVVNGEIIINGEAIFYNPTK